MSGYKEHFEKRVTEKAEAESKAQALELQKKEKFAASLVDGKIWLEREIVPELQKAKDELVNYIRIEFSTEPEQKHRPGAILNEIRFTVNPWSSGSYRSYIFAVCTGEVDNFWIESRMPNDDGFGFEYKIINQGMLSGKFRSANADVFRNFLKERIDSVVHIMKA